ncbi:MAG TPA: metallophosphoesterase [Candidatus Binatia bacterium]|nr:metallophosphoesterase [Candidatus Binatia bacterium]
MTLIAPELLDKRKKIVEFCIRNRILLTRDVVEKLQNPELVDRIVNHITDSTNPASVLELITSPAAPAPSNSADYPVSVLWDYDDLPSKRSIQDFIGYFNARYTRIAKMLRQRQELQNATSISRILASKERQPAAIIAMVVDKDTTKNDNLIITFEDPTGIIKAVVSKEKQDLFALGQDIVHDEVVGITATSSGNGMLFVNGIFHPDIPHQELKKSPDEAYAVFLSCVHVGSARFLHEAFDSFLRWIRGEEGSEQQRAMAAKVGYVFLIGDNVDGVGIYPNQEKELAITDIYAQYAEAARLLRQIPPHIKLIISPGNHDALRMSEPQPKLFKDYAKPLWDMPNVIMTGNPSIVTIHAKDGFPGFNVLTYHGFSFDDYSEIVPSIKNSGRNCSERAPLIMKFLLQRRHLAPQHTSTLYIPDPRSDPLIVEHVPDIFAAGHIHKSNADSYRGVTIVCCSTFQAKTDFQERVGHEPDPGKIPVVNLQTRRVHMLKFGDA